MEEKPKAIIVDIDGTIADLSHRLHHIKDGQRDWDTFYDKMVDDEPIHTILGEIKIAKDDIGFCHVLFVTGRRATHRAQTIAWLIQNVPFLSDSSWTLYMREDGDTRPDYVMKAEVYQEQIEPKFKVERVFEDRPTVIRMWQEQGLDVVDVGNGVDF